MYVIADCQEKGIMKNGLEVCTWEDEGSVCGHIA